MLKNLLKILLITYNSKNPWEMLQELLPTDIELECLYELVPQNMLLYTYNETLTQEIQNIRKKNQWSKEAIRCNFIYFATAFTHIFGKYNDIGFIPKIIFTYHDNKPIPCIWLDVDKSYKYNVKMIRGEQDVKVMIYTGEKGQKTTKVLLKKDGEVIESLRGSFVIISYIDHIPRLINSPFDNCIVILTLKMNFIGAFLKKQPCFVACHNQGQ